MIYSFILVDNKKNCVLRQFRGSFMFANSLKKDYSDCTLYLVEYPKEGEYLNVNNPVQLREIYK
jgi:hypothetical protein